MKALLNTSSLGAESHFELAFYYNRLSVSAGQDHTRWIDARIATVRTEQGERPAMTGDVSPGGMQLALVGETATTLPRQIAINVAFEEQVVKFWGEVVYSSPKKWGLLVGVRFNRQPAAVRDFLFRRYVC